MHLSKEPTVDYLSVVAERTLSGMTADEIAAQLGTSRNTVQRYRRKASVPVPQGRPLKIDPSEVIQIINDGLSGAQIGITAAAIATQLGASSKTIQRCRQKANVSVPQGRPLEIDPSEVTQLTNDGLSDAQIGNRLGASRQAINGHRRKNGDVSPKKEKNSIRERPLSGHITTANNFKDRRAERDILEETLATDMGLVRMFFDIHTTGALTEERANALASFSNGSFQKRLMSQNGQTLKMLGKRAVKLKVFADQRPELNPIFAADGVTPVRTSIEGDAEYIMTKTVLERLHAAKLSHPSNS
jgi:DNA-binding CsgD family transcriptional regulator